MPPSSLNPGRGMLLLAEPVLTDANFKRAVVLLCEHQEAGSFGLIMNRPRPVRLTELTDAFPGLDQPLFWGGPVQQDTLHVLHRVGERVEGAIEVASGVFWGGEIEVIHHLLASGQAPAEDFRFYLGYAGWSGGQLEEEIRQGGWTLAPADAALVFHEEPERLWRVILRRMGGEHAILANFPDDPRLN